MVYYLYVPVLSLSLQWLFLAKKNWAFHLSKLKFAKYSIMGHSILEFTAKIDGIKLAVNCFYIFFWSRSLVKQALKLFTKPHIIILFNRTRGLNLPH